MTAHIIYMTNGSGTDPAIMKGLREAGCVVRDTHTVAETIHDLRGQDTTIKHDHLLLVAEVQAGAIPLLTLMRESGIPPLPTMLFDQDGNNLQPAIRALQLGVKDYVLASEPPAQREMRARIMAERILTAAQPDVMRTINADPQMEAAPTDSKSDDFLWDPEAHIIYAEEKYVRLSPVEGRVFDLLLSRRNHLVNMDEIISHGLQRDYPNLDEGIRLLRPHIMRLRNKLERYSRLAHRVVNMRGAGYMFI